MTDNARKTLMWLVPAVEKFPRAHKLQLGNRIGPLLYLLFAWARPQLAHSRDGGRPSWRPLIGVLRA
jgi:hypothetical protein